MAQRLRIVQTPCIGSSVFVSPHVPPPYSGMCGKITRVINKDKIRVKFAEGVIDEFPPILLMELKDE